MNELCEEEECAPTEGPKDALGTGSPRHSAPEFIMISAEENLILMLSSNCLSRGVLNSPDGSILEFLGTLVVLAV